MEELGVPAQAKEGVAFALLAWLTWNGLPGNVPSGYGGEARGGAGEGIARDEGVRGSREGRSCDEALKATFVAGDGNGTDGGMRDARFGGCGGVLLAGAVVSCGATGGRGRWW